MSDFKAICWKYFPDYFPIFENNGCGRTGFPGSRLWDRQLHVDVSFLGSKTF